MYANLHMYTFAHKVIFLCKIFTPTYLSQIISLFQKILNLKILYSETMFQLPLDPQANYQHQRIPSIVKIV